MSCLPTCCHSPRAVHPKHPITQEASYRVVKKNICWQLRRDPEKPLNLKIKISSSPARSPSMVHNQLSPEDLLRLQQNLNFFCYELETKTSIWQTTTVKIFKSAKEYNIRASSPGWNLGLN